jgi:hypothetical protein
MGVDLGGLDLGVPHELLDHADVDTFFEEMGGEASKWRKVWQLTRLTIPARSTATLTAFCKPDSSTWWRHCTPVRGSMLSVLAGKTYCQ